MHSLGFHLLAWNRGVEPSSKDRLGLIDRDEGERRSDFFAKKVNTLK